MFHSCIQSLRFTAQLVVRREHTSIKLYPVNHPKVINSVVCRSIGTFFERRRFVRRRLGRFLFHNRFISAVLSKKYYKLQFLNSRSEFARQFCRPFYRQRDNMPEKKPFQRLPTDVVPVNYDIRLEPNLKTFVFRGSEKIDVQVIRSKSHEVIQ